MKWLRDAEREERELGKWRKDSRTVKGDQTDYTENDCEARCMNLGQHSSFPTQHPPLFHRT